MMNIIAASRLRKSPFVASLFIGGVDAIKYADAASFSDNFKAQHDPTNPLIIPVSNILNYQTEPDGNGRLNIRAEIAGNFIIPDQVFDNNISDSGSRITYFVDSQGLATELGSKLFDSNPNFKYLLTQNIITISETWLSFTIADVPRVLDFEDAINIEDSAFKNYRNPNDRINIRNATNIIPNPATDSIFNGYNLNNRTEPKKVIYAHPDLETINNGSPLNSLQEAINNGADVRYVTNKSLPSNFKSGDVVISEIGATYLDFTITTPASSNNIDYYDVFILDTSNSTDVIRRLFPFQEITDTNTLLTGLEVNKNYKVEIQAVDVFYNKNERFNLGTVATTFNISQNEIGGNYVLLDENYISPIETKTVDVYVNGILNNTITNASKGGVYAFNLNEQTNYDIYLVIEGNQSNTINVTTTTTPALFQNAVAYYLQNEISGQSLELINGYNGVDVGNIVKDGEWYDYGTNESYVQIADNDDFSFTNGTSATDFVIKTEIIFDGFNSDDRAWLVSKRESNAPGTQEWQLILISENLQFSIWDDANNQIIINTPFSPTISQKYILGVTFINNELRLFIDGVRFATEPIASSVNFANTSSVIKLGNETFISNLNLVGRQKQTVFIKGKGWTDSEISDNYNNGNGTTI